MAIFTESTCLNWFNESSYKPIISWEEVEDILYKELKLTDFEIKFEVNPI